eukprot:TRINITY_DN6263_c0_g1_i1.p1 TRINITY_DN6263_c0_g1~~TRINITY_DN6263_c0_g1_i1.p1  ORF type:complete len:436 (-),score=56.11 TRINITY_DN6263_c0_g1_i1:20-1327(-)
MLEIARILRLVHSLHITAQSPIFRGAVFIQIILQHVLLILTSIFGISGKQEQLKKQKSFCAWTTGVSQVKWNRINPWVLASAHEGEVKIWDARKENQPLSYISVASTKINTIDWSHTSEYDILTCTQDSKVKFWNVMKPRELQATLSPPNPVAQALYTPFAQGVVTRAVKGDNSISLWKISDLSAPLRVFSGHTEQVDSFDWRIDPGAKHQYQLASYAEDQTLRFWSIDNQLKEACEDNGFIPNRSLERSTSKLIEDTSTALETTGVAPHHLSLSEELSIVEKAVIGDGIKVEEASVATRSCTVSYTREPYYVLLKITFPQHYPHAQPCFDFLYKTNIPSELKNTLKEALSGVAELHAANSRHCLRAVLLQFSDTLKTELDLSNPSPAGSDSYSGSGKILGNLMNKTIPCPRLTGATFGANGKLFIIFDSQESLE